MAPVSSDVSVFDVFDTSRRSRAPTTAAAFKAKAAADGLLFLGHGSTRLLAQSARQAGDRVIDRAAMGPERVGPDIFQSSPIMRRGARHRYVSF